jgi:pimeloyl-ACP methyl ester carboxylesterase
MATLDGTAIPVDLGFGVTLLAPGLLGRAEREPELLGGRADESPPATSALADSLAAADLTQVHGIQIDAVEVEPVGGDIRGPGDTDAMVVQVPSLGPERQQILLMVDEAGVATWHYPEPTDGGMDLTVSFTVSRTVATAPIDGAQDSPDRGLVALVGRKLLSVLVFPVLEAGVGVLARVIAARYEKKANPYRLRRFAPGETRTEGAGDLAVIGWGDVTDQRALLFIHGTFSTSHGGFSGLPDSAVGQLWERYQGRVFAFDHPTLSSTPAENVGRLLSLIPPGRSIPVDVVSHSRGGLVARALADATAGQAHPPLRLTSSVFVAAPNLGTALADDKNLGAFVNRMTTMLNLIPDGPWSVVTDVLAGVLDLVKIIAVGAVNGLPGLQSMDPLDPALGNLGMNGDPAVPYYAIDTNYEPTGSLLQLARAKDAAVDMIFGDAANDLVVPTDGVVGRSGLPGFPVPAERRRSFGRNSRVWHCSFFSQPQTVAALNDWCRAGAS